jgi:hypothetical protein
MVTTEGNVLRSLALAAAMALAGVSVLEPISFAQKASAEEHEDGEVDGADEDGKKNGNGEEDGEDELGWSFKARLNRAMLLWNDGGGGVTPFPGGLGNQRTRGARFVDNDQDNSGAEAEYKFKVSEGWTATIRFEIEAAYAKMDSVSQFDRDGDGLPVELNDALFELAHERWGKFVVGLQDSASDGTSNINLSGSNVLADAEVNNWNDHFFLRVAGVGLTHLRWGDFFAGPDVGESGRFVKYITPKIMGFEAAVSVGQPMDVFLFTRGPLLVEDKINGLHTDFGLRYTATWFNTLLVKAGFGVFRNTTEERDAEEPTEDTGMGGSLAFLHLPTGLNFAINHGVIEHTDNCLEPGVVTGRCRGKDQFTYMKGGILKKFFPWGQTAVYGEYYKGTLNPNLSDDELLRPLELNPEQALEVERSDQRVWGLGMVQTIDPLPPLRHYTTDIYLGYRNYKLDVNLLGANGAAVPARRINDWSAVLAGLRLRWGKIDKIGEDD